MPQVPSGPGLSSSANALIIYNGNLIAGYSNNVSQWNGSVWSPLNTGLNGTVNALAVYNGNLIAAVSTTTYPYVYSVKKWDGSTWRVLSSAFDGQVNALTVYNGNLIAGGVFDTLQGFIANYIVQYNGSSWQKVGSGLMYYTNAGFGIAAMTIYNSTLVLSGLLGYSNYDSIYGIVSFNGTNWSNFGKNAPGGRTLIAYNGNLIVGGTFTVVLGSDTAENIAQWNGSVWTTVGTSKIGTGVYNQSPVVLTLINYNSNLIAGGSFLSVGSWGTMGLAEFNGSTWSVPFGEVADYYIWEGAPGDPQLVPGPTAINSSIEYNRNLIVSGGFNSAGGVAASSIAQWNGSSWSAL